MLATNITQLIGHTPMLELQRFAAESGVTGRIIAKLEYFNPGGSIKDRIALAMVDDAERRGVLRPGGTIVEPTSGNTGIGLAMVGTARGYRVILTMPESMSMERRLLLRAYGAELRLTPAAQGMKGAIAEAEHLRDTIDGAVILGQFDNGANPAVHYATTGVEIIDDMAGQPVDTLVAGVGTGGTISGTARRLKEAYPDMVAVAVEPAKSPVLSGGSAGPHGIMGIGAGFVPKNYDAKVIDAVMTIGDDEAKEAGRRMAHTEGVLVGISSGAALAAAVNVARENPGKTIVVICPDGGERYLSTDLFK